MTPNTGSALLNGITFAVMPTRTFKLNPDTKRISSTPTIDARAAVEQAIYIYLGVVRYKWVIHSWQFGAELTPLIGKPPDYCCAEAERLITEALSIDDRITGTSGFDFDVKGKNIQTSFTAHTIYGDVYIETEVSI